MPVRHRVLSLETQKGKRYLSVYVEYRVATLSEVSFFQSSPKTEGGIRAGETFLSGTGMFQQIEVTIVPARRPGRRLCRGVNVNAEKVRALIEGSVKASAAWGWIGIGILVLVIVGLFGLILALGRR
jgi:hypothetical protein